MQLNEYSQRLELAIDMCFIDYVECDIKSDGEVSLKCSMSCSQCVAKLGRRYKALPAI